MSLQAPKLPGQRRRRNTPERGEWQPTEAEGWQHGEIPEPPDGLLAVSEEVWKTWFGAWFAAHWTPENVPGLRIVIALYDERERYRLDPTLISMKANGDEIVSQKRDPSAELRYWMAEYGISPKGQQDRRWMRAEKDRDDRRERTKLARRRPYGHLAVVGK